MGALAILLIAWSLPMLWNNEPMRSVNWDNYAKRCAAFCAGWGIVLAIAYIPSKNHTAAHLGLLFIFTIILLLLVGWVVSVFVGRLGGTISHWCYLWMALLTLPGFFGSCVNLWRSIADSQNAPLDRRDAESDRDAP